MDAGSHGLPRASQEGRAHQAALGGDRTWSPIDTDRSLIVPEDLRISPTGYAPISAPAGMIAGLLSNPVRFGQEQRADAAAQTQRGQSRCSSTMAAGGTARTSRRVRFANEQLRELLTQEKRPGHPEHLAP